MLLSQTDAEGIIDWSASRGLDDRAAHQHART
jgi:hypothetical protein